MTRSQTPTIAVVDDDEAVRDALSNLLASLDLGVATFASAEAFLTSPACTAAACGPMIACLERAIRRSTGGNSP